MLRSAKPHSHQAPRTPMDRSVATEGERPLISGVDIAAGRLEEILGARVTRARGILEQHGRSEAYHPARCPDVVVYPETTEEVQRIVTLCSELRAPVVPSGAGTSIEGN